MIVRFGSCGDMSEYDLTLAVITSRSGGLGLGREKKARDGEKDVGCEIGHLELYCTYVPPLETRGVIRPTNSSWCFRVR